MDDTPDQTRSPDEVARRCVVLMAVVAAGHGVDRSALVDWLKSESLWSQVSPQEREMLTASEVTQRQSIDATWRVEALQPLAWALGLVEEMGSAESLCDVARLQSVVPQLGAATETFVAEARLRPDEELEEANEAAHELHWQARDAKLNDKKTTIDSGVIRERHYGLNWLIGYDRQAWDDITTDT